MNMKKSEGFTVLELTFAITIFIIAGVFFLIQKRNLEVMARDNSEKVAINAMYYNLEEVFYPTNHYYPRTISTDNLKVVDPALFTDPFGKKIGDKGSIYTYTPTECSGDQCKSYTLKADLENEADYVKNQKVRN